MVATTDTRPMTNSLTAGMLPKAATPVVLAGSLIVLSVFFLILQLAGATERFNYVGAIVLGVVLFTVAMYAISYAVEGPRKAADRLASILVTAAFGLALIPLISLIFTVITFGSARFDLEFFTYSLRNIVGEGGGAVHAIVGTVEVTLAATALSVPIGILTAIYLVEYGRGRLAQAITFFVDVMTGIPSIVAGLFAYALFVLFTEPGIRMGFGGAVALSVLMIPIVVRSTEEMLKLVPNELREAAYALGVPKWLTIVKVVLPTSLAGILTGVMLAVARVIGETAPLLIIAGYTSSLNYNLFSDRMMTLPVFVYNQYVAQGQDSQAYVDRAWTGALVLILIVMLLNLIARIVARAFAPKAR